MMTLHQMIEEAEVNTTEADEDEDENEDETVVCPSCLESDGFYSYQDVHYTRRLFIQPNDLPESDADLDDFSHHGERSAVWTCVACDYVLGYGTNLSITLENMAEDAFV